MPELTFLKTIGGTTDLRIFSITDYPQLCKFFLLHLPYCVTICNPKTIPSQNVNSTIQGLYQRSCWCSPFFIYPLLKERRFSPCRFSTFLSLSGYPSMVSPARLMTLSRSSCGLLCLSRWLLAFSFCSTVAMMTAKIEPQHSIERGCSHDWWGYPVLLLHAVPHFVPVGKLLITKSK